AAILVFRGDFLGGHHHRDPTVNWLGSTAIRNYAFLVSAAILVFRGDFLGGHHHRDPTVNWLGSTAIRNYA
ncbi:hypothetical protein VS883_28860, partial [Escherichia coli]